MNSFVGAVIALCLVTSAWPASAGAQAWVGEPGRPELGSVEGLITEASVAFSVGDRRAARLAMRDARRASRDDDRVLVADVALRGGSDPGLVLTLSDETLAALAAERAAIDGQQAAAIGLGVGAAALGVGAGVFALLAVLDDGCGWLSSSCVSDPNESWFVGSAIAGGVALTFAITSIVLLVDGASRSGRWHQGYRSGRAPSELAVAVSASPEGGGVSIRGMLP